MCSSFLLVNIFSFFFVLTHSETSQQRFLQVQSLFDVLSHISHRLSRPQASSLNSHSIRINFIIIVSSRSHKTGRAVVIVCLLNREIIINKNTKSLQVRACVCVCFFFYENQSFNNKETLHKTQKENRGNTFSLRSVLLETRELKKANRSTNEKKNRNQLGIWIMIESAFADWYVCVSVLLFF